MPRNVFTDFDFQGVSKPINLPAPTNSGDAANKAYVDSAVEGLAWKDSCRVATQANLNLASPGATIDGITMASGDRVLVRAQTAGAENGIYVWNGAATAMVRSLDANTFPELEQATTTVEEGTGAGVTYRQTAVNGTLGTTAVSWTTLGTSAPTASTTQAGIMRLATQAEVDTGTAADLAVSPQTLTSWSGRLRKVSANVGDGSATSYTVTHNLNTRDVIVRVFPNSGTFDDVEVDVQRTSVNAVAVVFATAPAANAYRVVVLG
jgi:hypothetical protein